jgi:cytoskeletal protein RodZ
MRFTIGLIVGIILGVVIAVGGLFLFDFFSARSANPPTASPSSTFVSSPSVSTTNSPVNGNPTTSSTRSLPGSPPTTSAAVNFDLTVTNISGTGLSRTITWQITNTGTIDAHNVSVEAQIYSQGDLVKVNGLDSISETLGTIQAGETITDNVTLSFSVLDAPKILLNGATINLTVSSDEITQTITYDYKP